MKYTTGFYKVNNLASPALINIRRGDKVQWINDGVYRVTLVSKEALWVNNSLSSKAKFTYTFNITENYTVYLKEKTNMKQLINVT
jgi:plastocyanin